MIVAEQKPKARTPAQTIDWWTLMIRNILGRESPRNGTHWEPKRFTSVDRIGLVRNDNIDFDED